MDWYVRGNDREEPREDRERYERDLDREEKNRTPGDKPGGSMGSPERKDQSGIQDEPGPTRPTMGGE